MAISLILGDGGVGKLCLMASCGQDHSVKLWNVTLGIDYDIELLRVLEGHSASVMCVRISTTAGLIASASGDKTVRLWDVSLKFRSMNCLRFPWQLFYNLYYSVSAKWEVYKGFGRA